VEITFVPYKRKKRKARKRAKSRQALERELWRVFSLWVRTRDKMCMMGGKDCSGPIQAGHIIGRRKLPTKYDEMNVWGQCRKHNWLHNRNPERYIAWFIRQHGAEAYTRLVDKSMRPGKALSPQEIESLIKRYGSLS
jgi:hypothetical protein